MTIPQPEKKAETKPVAKQANTSDYCSCYQLLLNTFGRDRVPSMDAIHSLATKNQQGNVAFFTYPPNEQYPKGIPHVGLATFLPDGEILIEEFNYHSCRHTTRVITKDDKRLIGFLTL